MNKHNPPYSLLSYIGKIFLLAFLYILTGKLGLMLAIPPGYVTVIWPPSGIALGLLILFGYGMWPGVMMGSFLLNAAVAGGISLEGGILIEKCGVPLLIAVGSTLQVIAGKFFLEKFLYFPLEIGRPRNVLKFLFISAPLTCLIAASIGSVALHLGAGVPLEGLATSWINWWVGDMFGVIVFLPLILILPLGAHRLQWGGKPLGKLPGLSLLMVILCLALTFYSWKVVAENVYQKSKSDFQMLALESEKALLGRLDSYRYALLGGAGFFQGSEFVSREEWRQYVQKIDIKQNFPGINGIGFIASVEPGKIQEFLKETRVDHSPHFFVHPHTENTPYFIIKYIEPEKQNKPALGLNIAFEKNRLAAAEKSRDSGNDTITDQVLLVQDERKTPGFLLFHPLYKTNKIKNTLEELRQDFFGWIYAPFVANKFLHNLTASQGQSFNMKIYDGPQESIDDLIYSSDASESIHETSTFVIRKPLKIMQKTWLVVWTSTAAYERDRRDLGSTFLLVGGLLCTGLLALFLMETMSQRFMSSASKKKESTLALPLAVFLIVASVSFYFYRTLQVKELDYVRNLVEGESKRIVQLISLATKEKILSLKRMAQRWEVAGGTPFAQWSQDAKNYIDQISGLKTLEWVDSTYHVRWVEPLQGNEKVVDLNIVFEEKRRQALDGAAEKSSLTITPPLDLVQGYKAFIVYVPVRLQEKFDGFMTGIFSIDDFLGDIIKREALDRYDIQLKYEEEVFYRNQYAEESLLADWYYEKEVEIFDKKWMIVIRPTLKLIQQNHSYLPLLTLVSGLIIAALLSLSVRFALLSRIKAEHLRISEERNRLLVDGAQDFAIYMLDAEGNVGSWNKGAEIMKGYQPHEIIGKHFSIFYTPEDLKQEKPSQVLSIASSTGKFHEQSWRVRKDGTRFIADVEISALYSLSGNLIGFTKITRDVTKKMEQELQLKNLAYRLELATNSAGIGVWEWDIESNTLAWDRNMYLLYGISAEQFTTAYEVWEKSVHPEDRERTVKYVYDALAGKSKFDTSFRVIWPDGSTHFIRAIADVVLNENAKATKMTGVNWDITNEKEIEQMKNEFISTVSHEIRTPLTSIYVSLEIMKDSKVFELPEDIKTLVHIASESCERLTRLINDVLDVEKIESGKMVFYFKKHELSLLIQKAVNSNQAYARQLCQVSLVVTQDLPSVFVSVDEDKFIQIMTNLISNACKFSPHGSEVSIRVESMGKNIRISVSDHGPGIPEEFRGRVFQKFAQADGSNTRQQGGTGLGLSICKSIVEKHGGTIGFESRTESETGTTFYFELPELK